MPSVRDAAELTLTPPRRPLPPGACDCHSHVFGPFDRFPLAELRSYDPPLAPRAAHDQMLSRLGFSRAVLIQPSAYGVDLACILDAIAAHPARTRGVGVVNAAVTDAELDLAHAGGVRAMRFTEAAPAGAPGARFAGASGFAELIAVAPALRTYGMHAEIFAPLDVFMEAAPQLLALGLPLVLDHMAKVGPGERRPDDANFQRLLGLLADGLVWVKMTVFRNSTRAPDYPDMRPFAEALIEANPDQLIWGNDWPLLNLASPPDIGRLIDLFDAWLGEEELRRRIYADNPARLYGF